MKYPVYSYRDIKTGFMPPQCDQSDQTAIRGFSYAINSKDGLMNYAPSDFELYRIGSFDTETGKITEEIPTLIVTGVNVYGEKD